MARGWRWSRGSSNQWCDAICFNFTGLIQIWSNASFYRELMSWTVGFGYVLIQKEIQRVRLFHLFSFSFYFKTGFSVLLRGSIICTARLVLWISLLTRFDIIQWSIFFLIFIFFYYLIKLQKLITLSFLIQKIPFFLLKSSFIFLFLIINFPKFYFWYFYFL